MGKPRQKQQRKSGWRELAAAALILLAIGRVANLGSHGHPAGHAGQPQAEAAAPAHLTASHRHQAAAAVAWAKTRIGDWYCYGAPTDPRCPAGTYDCSGLIQAAWHAAGVDIPRTSEGQYAQLRHVPLSEVQPGDLIFETGSPVDPPPGHVVLYLGRGKILEAYATGYQVRIQDLRPDSWADAARP